MGKKHETVLQFFLLDGYNRKTYVFDVYNNTMCLGQVKWYSPWRRYCYFPLDSTLYDAKCLFEVEKFLNELMGERKNGKKDK